jgi:hypothetical protein
VMQRRTPDQRPMRAQQPTPPHIHEHD